MLRPGWDKTPYPSQVLRYNVQGLMQKVRRLMHKVGINFSSCTVPSSANICSSIGGIQEKGKTWVSLPQRIDVFLSFTLP
jgi:hypothetical protein